MNNVINLRSSDCAVPVRSSKSEGGRRVIKMKLSNSTRRSPAVALLCSSVGGGIK